MGVYPLGLVTKPKTKCAQHKYGLHLEANDEKLYL